MNQAPITLQNFHQASILIFNEQYLKVGFYVRLLYPYQSK